MIDIQNRRFVDLQADLQGMLYADESNKSENDIALNNILSEKSVQILNRYVELSSKGVKIAYEELAELSNSIQLLHENLSSLKDKIDLDIFFKDGYTLDISAVKQKFKNKRLGTKFPEFNFARLDELYKNPPTTLKTFYSDELILIDPFIFRKYLIGILQMVLDHMDLVVALTGSEGSGKSTHVSQLMYMVYWLLHELKITSYDFAIKNMFFNSLENLRLIEDKFFSEPYRILALDEGNELHRQNWREEEVATFFQRLRRERFNQRIKFICIPVLGELMPQIVQSRVNFIHEMVNTSDVRTGSLNKGRVNFYVVPRGNEIYSPKQKRNLSKANIKTALHENLKDKNYLKGFDPEILVHTYGCNGTWGFPEKLYIQELKDSNKTFKITKGFKLQDWEAWCLYKTNIKPKMLGLAHTDVLYSSLTKSLSRLRKYFEENEHLYNTMTVIHERKNGEMELKKSISEQKQEEKEQTKAEKEKAQEEKKSLPTATDKAKDRLDKMVDGFLNK